jgi:hypothetical protein
VKAAIHGCTSHQEQGHPTKHPGTLHQTLVTRLPLYPTRDPSRGRAKTSLPWLDSSKFEAGASQRCFNPFPGGYSAVVPPDPIPNSEVKRSCADGSVDFHARVGHRQGLYPKNAFPHRKAFCFVR